MLHMQAYSKSTDATADVDITPVSDDITNIFNFHFFPQAPVQVKAIFVCGTTLARARLVTPTLRGVSSPYVRPINLGNLPTTLPAVADYRDNPLQLSALEEVQLLATQTAAGPTQVNGLLLWDTGSTPNQPMGQSLSMRGTGATTAVVNAWTTVPVTWADTLPMGQYACVGLQAKGATMIAARMMFYGQQERPGCVGQTLLGDNGHQMFRKGGLGVWGYFNANRMPQIQVLCNVADTTQEFYMDFVRIG